VLEPRVARDGQAVPMTGVRRFSLDENISERVVAAALQGYSLWWTEGSPRVEPCLLMYSGLPEKQVFARLLDGN
jgi:type VI secretion system protein ImpM